MKKLNVVFIMGAGFSAEAGGPLISDFLDKTRKIYRISSDHEFAKNTAKDFENINETIGDLRTISSKAYLDLDNIETLFGALEFGILINKFGNKKGKEIEVLRDSLIRIIVTTIEYSIKYQYTYPESKVYPSAIYKKFFEKIKNKEPYCNFSFITFNYDLITDIGLVSSSLRYTYSLKSEKNASIPLLKLHGSLNWYEEEEIQIYPLPNGENQLSINKYRADSNPDFLFIGSQIIKEGKIPLIVPPTLNKFKYHEPLKTIWEKAAFVLSEAELVVIIGYSMPETDVFFKYLYSLGIDSPKYLHKLIAINSDGSIQSKYKTIVNQNDYKKFHFIPGLFSQYIDTIFIEIDNLIS